jgi:hypothetical protein
MTISRSDSQRLDSIDEKLSQIIELLTPNKVEIKLGGSEVSHIQAAKEEFIQAVKALPVGKVSLGKHSRKRMIKAAQDVHRILADNVYSSPDGVTFLYKLMTKSGRKVQCTAEFIVAKEKKKVICLLKSTHTNRKISKGVAICDEEDTFNADIGMAIALYRALKLNVPSNYFEIPNPTDYEAGQLIEWSDYEGTKYIITKVEGKRYSFIDVETNKRIDDIPYNSGFTAKILEDGVEVR